MDYASSDDRTRREVLERGATAATIGAVGLAVGSGAAVAQECDATVDDDGGADYASIQAAIDDASEGQTICVRPGTYEESVTVDTPVTVTGPGDPTGADAAVVDGHVEVQADDVTVTCLRVAPTETFTADGLDPHGILVSGELTDVTVVRNAVAGMTADSTSGSVTINGIQVWNDGPGRLTGTVVADNVVRDMANEGQPTWPMYGGAAGIKVQGLTEDTEVRGNTVTDIHSAGWAYGIVTTHTGNAPSESPLDTAVRKNTVEAINDGSVYDVGAEPDAAPYPGSAFAVDGNALASEAEANFNNLVKTPIGAVNRDESNELDAECNYWGHPTGPEAPDNPDGRGTMVEGDVDYRPWSRRRIGKGRHSGKSCTGGRKEEKGKGKGKGKEKGHGKGDDEEGKGEGRDGDGKRHGRPPSDGSDAKPGTDRTGPVGGLLGR